MSDVSVRETSLFLYVFSGPHLGAKIALPSGTWLLGSDDASDLILAGLAPAHAELEIGSGEPPTVTVRPRNGRVIYREQVVEDAISPVSGEPWYLGETLFVWNEPGVQQERIIPNLGEPSEKDGSEETGETADGPAAPAAVEEVDAPARAEGDSSGSAAPDDVRPDAADVKEEDEPVTMATAAPPLPFWKRMARPLPLALLALLLCALSFPLTSFEGPDPGAVQAILKELSIPSLEVRVQYPGVVIEGSVAKEEDRVRIGEAVGRLSFPVYLDVAIDEDKIRAVRNSLGSQGFFPVVRMVHGKESSHLDIACYMQDSLVEQAAFFRLEHDVPPPPKKERRIVYASDVEKMLRFELNNVGFSDIDILFLPGRVTFTGNCGEDRKPVLDRIRSSVSSRFGVPLFGETLSAFARASKSSGLAVQPSSAEATGKPGAASEDQNSGDLGGLVITGVFVAPLSFVTTEDGRYLFQGAVLPNGDQLVRISTKELLLRRGNKQYTYHLRGSQ